MCRNMDKLCRDMVTNFLEFLNIGEKREELLEDKCALLLAHQSA